MTLRMRVWCQTTVVFCIVVLTTADKTYENKLTKLWSLSSASNSDGPRTAVVNVTSASLLIEPSNGPATRTSRDSKVPYSYQRYAFKPRTISTKRGEQQSQVEKSVYYSQDNNKYKSDVLFPGNYFPIAEEKSNENFSQDYNPLEGGPFQPQTIPLIRDQQFQRRSLDVGEEPMIEKPQGFFEPSAQRRSISYLLGVGDDEEEEDDTESEYEGVDEDGKHHKKKPKKVKKLAKYMMPLLMAYKMKYFALVPLMIAGLILLVGATGMAGFFFALFAAVMGLQKGGY